MEQILFHQMADIQATHWWYEGRRKILESFIRRLGLRPGARILEIGCGTGVNLGMLKKYGAVTGIEPNDFARETATALSGCSITEGYLPNDLRVTGPYDLIGAFDVIEHIDDDLGSLQSLRALLSTDGVLLLTVPAYQFLWSQHDVANHHKRRYTKQQFAALLQAAGFRVDYISYYNTALFPLVVLVRGIKTLLKLKDTPDEAMPKISMVNSVLRTVFAAERHLLKYRALPFGVSIIAQCRQS